MMNLTPTFNRAVNTLFGIAVAKTVLDTVSGMTKDKNKQNKNSGPL
jgi:hypothetical protein